MPKIFFKEVWIWDDFAKRDVMLDGWTYEGGIGLFDSYVSAMADSMGLWEEYCEYHRTKG